MRMGPVHDFSLMVWKARDAGEMKRDARDMARGLALAVAAEVRENEGYDPELDSKVLWLRELVAAIRHAPRWKVPRGSQDAEYAVMFLLGAEAESGKMRAAGE